jgi:signal transduction histidine kinase
VLAAPLSASPRGRSLDPILDQWYLTRDAMVAHVDDDLGGRCFLISGDIGVVREILKFRAGIDTFRRKPEFRFMSSSDPDLETILRDLDEGATIAVNVVAGDHTPTEVLRSLSSLQIAMNEYMYSRIRFSEQVARSFMFVIVFFVSACVLIIILVALFRMRLSSLERNEASASKFARAVINAQESERIAIARELHDTVAQDILCIKVATETMRSAIARSGRDYDAAFADLIGTETSCINRIREVCAELRPPELVHLGLKAAIGGLCAGFERANGIRCSCILFGDFALGYEEEINCYRIVQEALSNVRKHARATAVSVWIDIVNEPDASGKKLTMRISDDGIGMPQREAEAEPKGAFGLKGMRERVRILRGEMTISSEPDEGTTLTITIPLTVRAGDGYNSGNEKTRIGR